MQLSLHAEDAMELFHVNQECVKLIMEEDLAIIKYVIHTQLALLNSLCTITLKDVASLALDLNVQLLAAYVQLLLVITITLDAQIIL